MFWERIDDLEALRIGIQSEIDAYHYYKDAQKHFNDREAKELLAALANEEKKHRLRLEEEYARLSGKRLLYINLPKKRRLAKPFLPEASDLEILSVAIEQEREARDFYEKAAKRTIDPQGRLVFEELIKEEQRHFDLLEAELHVREKSKSSGSLKMAKA